MIMYNNGSHFGADEEYFLIGYALLVILWIVLIFTHLKPILRSINKNDEITRLLMYGAFVVLGLGYLYRFLDVVLVYYNGDGV